MDQVITGTVAKIRSVLYYGEEYIMKNMLIGSRALNYWCPEHKITGDTDWDVISLLPIKGAEFHDRYLLNNEEFEAYTGRHYLELNGEKLYVVSMTGLAVIKRSHLWRDLGFNKHIAQFHRHFSHVILYEWDRELLQQRTEMTHARFPQKGPNLRMQKDAFFRDAVRKEYDHDWLHEQVAYHDAPLYTLMQNGDGTAWCLKDAWDRFTEEQKRQCVAEEVMVLAIERFMLPNRWQFPAKLAYIKALQKISTTACSGWFRDYAIDWYPEILDLFDHKRIEKVQDKIKEMK